MSVDTMLPNDFGFDFGDIAVIFGIILAVGSTVALYNWIDPSFWVICSVAGFVVLHGLCVLLFGPENRVGRVTFWVISTVLLLEGAVTVGVITKIFNEPKIVNFCDNLPLLVKMALSPFCIVAAILSVFIAAVVFVLWIVFTVESMWPKRKTYML